MARQSQDSIEALLEVLGLLRITEEYISEEQNYKTSNTRDRRNVDSTSIMVCLDTNIFFYIFFLI